MEKEDLIGKKINKWIIISKAKNRNGKSYYLCRCECGKEKEVNLQNLKRNLSKSCGCLRNKETAIRNTTHNLTGIPEHGVWFGIKARCLNPKNSRYNRYGGRGITICDEWKDSFEQFYADMGPRPSNKHSIERRNNDLGYNKDNCYWVTNDVQSRNRINNINITWNGKTQCLLDWTKELFPNNSYSLLEYRLKKGWNIEKILTTPAQKRK